MPRCSTVSNTARIQLIAFLSFGPQPVFLADFKQIKKIQCLSQSDGKALLDLNIEGARQVSTTTLSTCYVVLLCTVLRYRISRICENISDRKLLHRKFDPRFHCPLVLFPTAAIVQRGHGADGREHDGPYWRLLPLGKWHGWNRYLPTKQRCVRLGRFPRCNITAVEAMCFFQNYGALLDALEAVWRTFIVFY